MATPAHRTRRGTVEHPRYTEATIASALLPWEEPSRMRRPRAISIRMFRSPSLERLAHAHWVTPIVWFGPAIVYGAWKGWRKHGAMRAAALFLAGWLTWTLLEYLLHRFLFHRPATTMPERIRSFLSHGYHHVYPDDPGRLVAPPLMSWPPALIIGLLLYLSLGARVSWPVFAGIAAGYVAYDWIHYYVHHARPKTTLGRALREYHMRHHFEDTHRHYGVSSPLWDIVFRTT